jgi:transposase-like protein
MEQEKKHRRHFDRDFKLDAVKLVNSGRRPLTEVARDLGVRSDLLRKWKGQFDKQAARAAFPVNPDKTPEQVELDALKKTLARVEEEREILKKALAVFSLGRP